MAILTISCFVAYVTGYAAEQFPGGRTYDGTPVSTREAIVAADWHIPIDTLLHIEGFRRNPYRVADRGRLAYNQIDVLVPTVAEAFDLTGNYEVCPWPNTALARRSSTFLTKANLGGRTKSSSWP